MTAIWTITEGTGPVVATAIHDGHDVRQDVEANLALPDANRLREEDPFTGILSDVAPTRVIVTSSRFQVDLNRPRDRAVYVKPEDAWGLHVRKQQPTESEITESLKEYDEFYAAIHGLLSRLTERYGKIVVFDLHTYNHRRDGAEGPEAPPLENPEVNLGTGTMNRTLWAPVVDRFVADMSKADFMGRSLDVRENVKFRGGQFGRWIHESFPDSVCALSIEFKKFFMDEWTGQLNDTVFKAMHAALRSTVAGVNEELHSMSTTR